jgi:hypothetical protein
MAAVWLDVKNSFIVNLLFSSISNSFARSTTIVY